jgi:hypothetical protein
MGILEIRQTKEGRGDMERYGREIGYVRKEEVTPNQCLGRVMGIHCIRR